jgi:acyl carrier protein
VTDDILPRIKKILTDQFDVADDAVKPDAKLAEDFRLDSIEGVELIFALEEEFGVEITDAEVKEITTVGDLVEAARQKLAAKADA